MGRDVDLVDLTMHAARIGKLGLLQESRDAFALLERAGWIQSELSQRMQAVVGAAMSPPTTTGSSASKF